jgi:hypothetical protein
MPSASPAARVSRPRFVTARFLAQRFSVTPETVRDWARKKKIPPPIAPGGGKKLWDLAGVLEALGVPVGGGADAAPR